MQVIDYFDILSENDIRIKGTRVGVETVLFDFLEGSSPEEIAVRYRAPSLEQVYATITFYLHERVKVDAYLEACRRDAEQAYHQQQQHPDEVVMRLRKVKQPVG